MTTKKTQQQQQPNERMSRRAKPNYCIFIEAVFFNFLLCGCWFPLDLYLLLSISLSSYVGVFLPANDDHVLAVGVHLSEHVVVVVILVLE